MDRLRLRSIFRRLAFPSIVVFAFWGTAWIFILGFASWYFDETAYHPAWMSFWLFQTVIAVFPGMGILGAALGMLTRDKPTSFMVGLVPNLLNFAIYSAMPALGFVDVYADIFQSILGFLTLLLAGVGLGLIGLAGSYYGDYREGYRALKSREYALSLVIVGFFLWLFIVWVWPGYGIAAPGLGIIY